MSPFFMRIAIVGSRNYPVLSFVRAFVRRLPSDAVIVSGGAKGVDYTAELTARECGLTTRIFKPDWNLYGKSAGYQRNILIVEDSDIVVAFYDNESLGTKHTIDIARKMGKPVVVYGLPTIGRQSFGLTEPLSEVVPDTLQL